MKETDHVELITEIEQYARWGVHKGMNGWICHPKCVDGSWLVNFPQCGKNPDIETLGIQEDDLRLIPVMRAIVNEEIKAKFDA